MKRCPQCHRPEPDDTLAFCRADGTALINDSGPVGAEAGTAKFVSAPVSSEIDTSVLPQHATDAGISRPTAVLPNPLPPPNTRELSKPKQRKAIIATAAVIAVAKELEERYARKESNGRYVSAVYAGLGDKDKAFEWLEKDFQTQEDLTFIRLEIQFESLHDDPRFKDLLRRMGLPQ